MEENIWQEVQEEEILNKRLALLRLYLPYLLILLSVLIIGVTGSIWYKNYQLNQRLEIGAKYLSLDLARQQGKSVEKILPIAKEIAAHNSNYSALTLLLLASESLYSKQDFNAYQYLEQIINGKYDILYKHLAMLTWCEAELNKHDASVEKILGYLDTLMQKDAPFVTYAWEVKILLFKKYGRKDFTNLAMEFLSSDKPSLTQKIRVNAYLHY